MIKAVWRAVKRIRGYFRRSAKKRIIGEGLFAGMLMGITIRTGHDPHRGGFFIGLADFFCRKTNGFEKHLDCTLFVSALSAFVLFWTIFFLWWEIKKVNDRKILGLRIRGWLIGILIYTLSFTVSLSLLL